MPKEIQPATAEFMNHQSVTAHFGLTRPLAYQLAADGLIKSVSVRKTGKLRGKRLFVADSIRAYLNSLIQK